MNLCLGSLNLCSTLPRPILTIKILLFLLQFQKLYSIYEIANLIHKVPCVLLQTQSEDLLWQLKTSSEWVWWPGKAAKLFRINQNLSVSVPHGKWCAQWKWALNILYSEMSFGMSSFPGNSVDAGISVCMRQGRLWYDFSFYCNGIRNLWVAFSAIVVFAFCGFSEY